MFDLAGLSIRKKIASIAVVAVLGFFFYFLVNYQVSISNQERLNHIEQVNFPTVELLAKCRVVLVDIRKVLNNAVTASETSMLDEDAYKLSQEISESLEVIAKLDKQNQQAVTTALSQFNDYYREAVGMSRDLINDTADYETLGERIDRVNALYTSIENNLNTVYQKNNQDFLASLQEANNSASDAVTLGVWLGLGITLLIAVTTWLIAGNLHGSLSRVIHSLHNLSSGHGDLTTRLESHSRDEIGDMVQAFNGFIGHLHGLISQLCHVGSSLSSHSSSVSDIATETKSGMETQTRELHNVADAFMSLKQAAHEISNNAAEAARNTEVAITETERGCKVLASNHEASVRLSTAMEQANTTVNELAQESDSIGAVLDVIRGIAEQTNLLALNAAIEAARAGEQGRGFAVVADEVRHLAGRTQDSTAEIHDIIERLQGKARDAVQMMETGKAEVEHSAECSREAEGVLTAINQAVADIKQINFLVASATEEQSSVANEINSNVEIMRSTTDTTTERARSVYDESQLLQGSSQELHQLVSKFTV